MEYELLKLQTAVEKINYQNEKHALESELTEKSRLLEKVYRDRFKGLTRQNMVSREFHSKYPDFSHSLFGITPSFPELLVFLVGMFPDVTFDESVTGDYGTRISAFERILI